MKHITVNIKGVEVFFLVDEEDFEWLSKFIWSGFKTGDRYYAATYVNRKSLLMHRLLMRQFDNENGLVVDHIDRNSRNNCKYNLRLITQSENTLNCARFGAIKGVHFDKSKGNWVASTRLNGRKINIGRFKTEDEAKAAYTKFKQENP